MTNISPRDTRKFQRWIVEELELQAPCETKLAKICKGTLATLWQELVDNCGSNVTHSAFHNNFLEKETNEKENTTKTSRNDKKQQYLQAIQNYRRKISQLERQIDEIEQQVGMRP